MTFLPSTDPHLSAVDPAWFPRYAVFDCDGVLMDTESGWVRAVELVSREMGVSGSQDLADKLTALPAEEIARSIAEHAAPPEAGEAEIASLAEDVLARLTRLDEERLLDGVELIPGALEAVRELAAVVPVAVASNSSREILRTKLEAGGYLPLLGAWVSCDDVAAGKPAPDMYQEAVRRLGGTPSEALTFEDSMPGATAAVAAGTRVVALVPDPGAEAVPAHFSTDSFQDPAFREQLAAWIRAAREAGAGQG